MCVYMRGTHLEQFNLVRDARVGHHMVRGCGVLLLTKDKQP